MKKRYWMKILKQAKRTKKKATNKQTSILKHNMANFVLMDEPETIDGLIMRIKSCFYRSKYDDVISIANKIWDIDKEEPMACYFKGKAYMEMKDYTNAINNFEMALDLGISAPEDARETRELLTIARTKKTLKSVNRNWYQTDSHVIIHVMIKNMRRQHVHVLFEEKNVICSMKIPPFNIFYDLFLNLARPIVPENSVIVVLKNKVEIRMEKEDPGMFWEVLDLDTKAKYAKNGGEVKTFWKIPENENAKEIEYSSWDEVVTKEKNAAEEEKLENWDSHAAVHRLFQHIYDEADDDKKKAMVKSFIESGGTSMTTDWKKAKA